MSRQRRSTDASEGFGDECEHRWTPWDYGQSRMWRECPNCDQVEVADLEIEKRRTPQPAHRGVAGGESRNSGKSTQHRGQHNSDAESIVVFESPPPDALDLTRGRRTGAARQVMDENPGEWVRWGENVIGGPSAASRLRRLGYQAKYRRRPDGTYTIWCRRPTPVDELTD
jgi:hypothetical protein